MTSLEVAMPVPKMAEDAGDKPASPVKKRANQRKSSSSESGLRVQEMSPEAALVEFISTSAAYFGVKRQSLEALEWDILHVIPDNIMPANAAAWYMAKRRFYMNNQENNLLPFMLKSHPKKFAVQDNHVEFLEIYGKDIARKKMNSMVRQGLVSYFAHKVEEYGVYFFDPLYYETTEPFHASLRKVSGGGNGGAGRGPRSGNHRSRLLPSFFGQYRDRFHFKPHSPYLVTISRPGEALEVLINKTGVITSMVDNQYGIMQFTTDKGKEKAFFSAKTLFKDGFPFNEDPMRLGPMEFDGYRIPAAKAGNKGYSWYAVLVWCGRKPSPRFCANSDDLSNNTYFQNNRKDSANGKSRKSRLGDHSGPVHVGQVMEIRKNGAVVGMGKDTDDKAFIQGWMHKNARFNDVFLTTTQGVELAKDDLITFGVDPKRSIKDFKALGCNVTVLRHNNSGNAKDQIVQTEGNKSPKKMSKKSKSRIRKNTDTAAKKEAKGEKRERRKSTKRPSYGEFLLTGECPSTDEYDSDEDPSFLASLSFDPDLDYDEYSNGEISDSEQNELLKESVEELDLNELKKKIEEAEIAKTEAKKKATKDVADSKEEGAKVEEEKAEGEDKKEETEEDDDTSADTVIIPENNNNNN